MAQSTNRLDLDLIELLKDALRRFGQSWVDVDGVADDRVRRGGVHQINIEMN